jgi:hypothetical protein
VSASEAGLEVFTSQSGSDHLLDIPAPLYKSGSPWSAEFESQLANATLISIKWNREFDKQLCFFDNLIESARPPNNSWNPVLAIEFLPSCYPEDITVIAQRYGYKALIIGSPCETPGSLASFFWKHHIDNVQIPIFDISVSALVPLRGMNISYISIKPSSNYFDSAPFLGLCEVLNGVMLLLNIESFRLCFLRFKANWKDWKSMNLAAWICVLEFIAIIWRFIFGIDPCGICFHSSTIFHKT